MYFIVTLVLTLAILGFGGRFYRKIRGNRILPGARDIKYWLCIILIFAPAFIFLIDALLKFRPKLGGEMLFIFGIVMLALVGIMLLAALIWTILTAKNNFYFCNIRRNVLVPAIRNALEQCDLAFIHKKTFITDRFFVGSDKLILSPQPGAYRLEIYCKSNTLQQRLLNKIVEATRQHLEGMNESVVCEI